MTRYLLDTNIISNATRPRPSPPLIAWMSAQVDADLFISSLTIAEIWRGVLDLAPGRKRTELEVWFTGAEGPETLFGGRVLAFDERAAHIWARLMSKESSKGQPRSPLDMIVAATALANDCVIVTDNDRHFAGLSALNPLRD